MKLAHGLILIALLAAGPVLAQAPVNRFEFQLPIRPAVGGWYSPQTNLGGLTFDIIPSATRPVVSGNWTYIENGIPVTVFYQGEMHYSTQPQAVATGLIADFTGPTYTLTGRSDYVDPQYGGAGTALLTGRSIRMEFESARVGTFIDNPGHADERRFPVVATLRGAPLVAPVDFAGDWAAMVRWNSPTQRMHEIAMVKLSRYTGPESYRVEDIATRYGFTPNGSMPTPHVGARRYQMECSRAAQAACFSVYPCDEACVPGTNLPLLWINANEVGVFVRATRQTDTTVVYDDGSPPFIAYADGDQILLRHKDRGGDLWEMQLVRLPTGVFELDPAPPF